MRVTDDDLRRLLLRPEPATREGCPTSDTLAAALAGRLADEQREPVVAHLEHCRACAADLIALRPLEPWTRDAARQLDRRPWLVRAWAIRPRWTGWAAAAAAVLALGLLLPRAERESPELRTPGAPAIRSLLPEGAPLARAQCLLRWSDAGPGTRYALQVLTKDLRPLATVADLERPEHTLPSEALREVPPGGEIVWFVEARRADGERLASPTFLSRVD